MERQPLRESICNIALKLFLSVVGKTKCLILVRIEILPRKLYSSGVKGMLGLAVLSLAVLGCRGPGGPMERAGRAVDNAVYDVGTGIKKTGQEIQQAAD
jgi:hypothetical protein